MLFAWKKQHVFFGWVRYTYIYTHTHLSLCVNFSTLHTENEEPGILRISSLPYKPAAKFDWWYLVECRYVGSKVVPTWHGWPILHNRLPPSSRLKISKVKCYPVRENHLPAIGIPIVRKPETYGPEIKVRFVVCFGTPILSHTKAGSKWCSQYSLENYPLKLTWPLKINVWKMNFLLGPGPFSGANR